MTEEQKAILKKMLKVSSTLKTCYELKESFRGIFNSSDDRGIGRVKLFNWILNVIRADTSECYGFARTLLNWEENILNYSDNWVISGFV